MQTANAYLPVRNSRVYYEMSGEGEPLLLMHGGFGTGEDFSSQIPELAKHFKVVAVERPGNGHTPDIDGPFSFATMSDDTVGFIEALGLGRTNLMGWSDGAIVALLVAISRPDLVKRLVSVSGVFNTSSLTPRALDWIRSSTPESFRNDAAEMVKRYDEASPDGPAHFPVVFEKTMRLWLNEPDIKKVELARIASPTLVLAGDRDMVATEHTLELFRSIKGAQLCIIPGATHGLLSEKPDAANRAILDFLLAEERPKS